MQILLFVHLLHPPAEYGLQTDTLVLPHDTQASRRLKKKPRRQKKEDSPNKFPHQGGRGSLNLKKNHFRHIDLQMTIVSSVGEALSNRTTLVCVLERCQAGARQGSRWKRLVMLCYKIDEKDALTKTIYIKNCVEQSRIFHASSFQGTPVFGDF